VSVPRSGSRPAVMLTGVGKRYEIVACFAQLAETIAVDPNPLAPARYAAQRRLSPPPISDPGYVPALQSLCAELRVGVVLPLTDLDLEVLARAREDGALPALVPPAQVARATFDKYEAHLLLERLGLPSAPTVLPDGELEALRYPVVVKPRRGSGARSIHVARSPSEARFFIDYLEGRAHAGDQIYPPRGTMNADVRAPVGEPVMVQSALFGEELSIDCLGDQEGRCINAIPRRMLESRGGESIKGTVLADEQLIALGVRVIEALGVRGPATIQLFRDPELGVAITDLNTRFGGAFPGPAYAALPGRTYPELIVRMAAGERIEPHPGEFRAPLTFSRYYWQLELDEQLRPTGRELVPGGPPRPLANAATMSSQ
jgi:carbamoyl-phosphate synthase large subunit